MQGRVLIIAGSDSGGGAGLQADIKTITALNGYAMTAVTALTAQNTLGVHGIHEVPPEFVHQQIKVVLEDLGADAIKIGMLGSPALVETVAQSLDELAPNIPMVLDPVMVAKGGERLLDDQAVQPLIRHLLPRAAVLTPNLPEAEALLDHPIVSANAMVEAATRLHTLGPRAVLLKGGHLDGPNLIDVLVDHSGPLTFSDQKINTTDTHGTGCTLASALACGLAQGLSIRDAAALARAYVRQAILTAPAFGQGHGPLNHAHTLSS